MYVLLVIENQPGIVLLDSDWELAEEFVVNQPVVQADVVWQMA